MVCVLLLAMPLAAKEQAKPGDTARIPTEAFATEPFVSGPKLSPDGTRVAAAMYRKDETLLGLIYLSDEAGGKKRGLEKVSFGEGKLRWYRWISNDLVLVSVLQEDRYAYFTRLYVYSVVASKFRYLGMDKGGLIGDDVLFVADDASYLLLSMSKTLRDYPAVYRVDIASGEMERVMDPKRPIHDWYADTKGIVRFGIGYVGRSTKMVYRDTAEEEFREIAKVSWDEGDAEVDTIRFRQDGDKGFVVTNARTGRFALYDFDWKTMEIGDPIFEHPQVDIDDYWLDADGELSAVVYTDDRERVEWLDESMKALQGEIDGALPGRSNWVVSRSKQQDKFIVWTSTSSDPGHYFYYDRANGVMHRLATPIDSLEGHRLAPMTAVRYTSRDGTEIPAYLTLPRERVARDLPLIVLPHGGPHARDVWGYDPDVQFLASRGYAVLQPNFRGSTGYGKAFLEKGYGQWGGAMQDDLSDGVAWLVEQGTVNPERVCIMGVSYGGYAALIGAIRTPEIYRCAISFAGVTDVDAWIRSHRGDMLPSRYKKWRRRVHGETAGDSAAPSPAKLASEVAIPVLLAHGTKDDRVPFKQAKAMAKAMRRSDKNFEFLEFKDAGHGYEGEDQIRFYNAVETFLNTHNPAN